MRLPNQILVTAAIVLSFPITKSFGQALVSGRVVDGSGNPLGDVLVQLAVKGLSTTTGADGTFELRDDATVLPFSSARLGVSKVELRGGMLGIAAGPRGARIGARLYDARGRVVSVVFEARLRQGQVLQAPVFERAAGVAHGVYVLEVCIDGAVGRYKILKAGRSAQPLLSLASPAALAKELAAVDTLRLTKSGCTTKDLVLQESGAALGDIVLACAGDELHVPPLTEYLTNDDTPVPTGKTVRWVSPTGSGSGISESSPGSLQAMLSASASGNVVVALGGFYDCPAGITIPAGVTLMAKPGEAAVVDGGVEFKAFRTPNSGAWTLVDGTKKIWKSSATFGSGGNETFGYWVEFDHVHQIVPAPNLAALQAPATAGESFETYAGPCGYLDADGHVYIRFQRPTPAKYSAHADWQEHMWPRHPEAVTDGVLTYPVTKDPNAYEIRLFRWGDTQSFNVGNGVTIGSGINAQGHRYTLRANASNITVRRGTFLNMMGAVWAEAGIRVDNVFFDRCRFSDGSKRHLSRAEWKFGGPLEPKRSSFLYPDWRGDAGEMGRIWFRNCTIADYHDIMASSKAHQQFRFRNCTVFNILDDGFQTSNMQGRIEIGFCFFLNSALGGNNDGVNGDDPNPGQWYVHHNVFDNRSNKNSQWGKAVSPGFMYLPHSPNGYQPRKNYNNTEIWAPDVEGHTQSGLEYPSHDRKNLFTISAHEVFNNIVIRHDVFRYSSDICNQYTSHPTDFVIRKIMTSGANEKWDYNLYYRDLPPPREGGQAQFGGMHDGLIGADDNTGPQDPIFYATLADFRASPHFANSKAAYAPGFEAHGIDAKPTLASIENFPADRFKYRPAPGAEVTTATSTSLSGENWWSTPPTWGRTVGAENEELPWDGLAPSAFKGALDPNGTEINVGALSP